LTRVAKPPTIAPMRILLVALLLAACASPPPSARVERAAKRPQAIWIASVSVLDVKTGRLDAGRDVLIANGRIAAIQPAGGVAAPPGALVISGDGATLVPGLVDMHGHVYANSNPIWVGGLPDPERNLRTYLYSGVTTVFDPGDNSRDAFTRRARVARGELIGPHIYTAGPIHTAPDGHPIALVREFAPAWIAWYVAPRVAVGLDSVEDANEAVDDVAKHEPDAVKIVIDEIPLRAPVMKPEVARAIVERARGYGLRTVAHVGTTQNAIAAGDAGVALWVHGVYKERIPDTQLQRLARYGIPMVATIEVFDSYARLRRSPRAATRLERETVPKEILDAFYPAPNDFSAGSLTSWQDLNESAMAARVENVKRLHEAGVTILAGSDTQSGVFAGPGLHRELANLVRAGFTPAEAIRAATFDPARFITKSDQPDFGSVEVGSHADLLLVDGDPTADLNALASIRLLLLDGVPIERTPVAN
jgi:imidazolonepropionase-like amidohydrolase